MRNELNPNYINVPIANLKTEYLQIDFIESALLPYAWKKFNLLNGMYIFLLFIVGTRFNLNARTGISPFKPKWKKKKRKIFEYLKYTFVRI